MFKNRLISLYCLFFTFSSLVVFNFLWIVEDLLFFGSDFISVVVVVTITSIILLILPLAVVVCFINWSEKITSFTKRCLAAALGATFLFLSVDLIFESHASFKWQPYILPLAFMAILFGLFKAENSGPIEGRAYRIARIYTMGSALFLMGFFLFQWVGKLREPENPKHAVIIFFDAWPAQYLNAYNPQAPERKNDSVLSSGRLFANVHTNIPGTHGDFGVFYSGSLVHGTLGMLKGKKNNLKDALGSDWAQKYHNPKRNLVSMLQNHDIEVRCIVKHRNAIPEGSSAAINHYSGLRSFFLTPALAQFWERVGLTSSYVYRKNKKKLSQTQLFLVDALNLSQPKIRDILVNSYLPVIRSASSAGKSSLSIFHCRWTDFSNRRARLQNVLKQDPDTVEKRSDIFKKIRSRQYRYLPEEEKYIHQTKQVNHESMNDMLEKIAEFIKSFEAENYFKNTLLILTADHGSIYDKGRVWYGYHPQEEVTRIPTVIYGPEIKAGTDKRNFETIDLSQTLLDFFSIKDRIHPTAVSMLDSKYEKSFTSSVTLSSRKNKEWFVNIYKDGKKYQFNIHPEGNGEALELEYLTPFDLKPVLTGDAAIQKVLPELMQLFEENLLIKLDAPYIHPKFTLKRFEALGRTN